MSQSEAQEAQNQFTSSADQTSRGRAVGPISLYMVLLMTALAVLLALAVSFVAFLPVLSVPFAIVLGWMLAGLLVCLLLYLWLTVKDRRIALAVMLALAIFWGVGLLRYVRGAGLAPLFIAVLTAFNVSPESISRVSHTLASLLTLGLAIGIPILVASWFLDLLPKFAAVVAWLLPWLVLVGLLQEVLVGAALLLSLVMSGVVFVEGLYLTSGFLLPLPEKTHRNRVFNFLRDHLLGANYPASVVVDERYEEDQVEERVPGNRFAASAEFEPLPIAPGFVITDCDQAVAISSGTKFKGVHGPGITFTGYADQIVRVFDLRPQLRAFHVEALTKDGIKVRVLVFTPFKIDSRGRQPRLGAPLPYNKNAAHKAFLAQRIEHGGKEAAQRAWHELPRIYTERILQNIISTYSFDDLYGPYQAGGEPPRKLIAQEFREQLAAELRPLGIQLIGGGISDLEPTDPKVYEERVSSWQAEWARKVALKRAEGQAEWLRMVERARAEAQADLILNLGRQLEELSVEQTALGPDEALALLVSILDGLMGQQPTLGKVVPGETLQALSEIRKAITG